ncbi:hypothetical protein KKF34_19065 [Myxococcota bacterium]|nr:hypothetical protein [Myxococcota bacterium]MBU1382840.1 hypothetical protein [Myxococcota bacterium]MBU1498989.1 hypothetical protein [Myxococcota bacterium]
MQGRIIASLLSLFFAVSCTVGEKFSENNNNTNNNTNNTNNTNTSNNTNNVNNINPDIPTTYVKGFWRLTEADVIMDTVTGTSTVTLSENPTHIVLEDASEVDYSVHGKMQFIDTGDTAGTMYAFFAWIDGKFIMSQDNDVISLPSTMTYDGTEVTITFNDAESSEDVTFIVERTDTTVELTFVDPGDSAYAGPVRLLYNYVGTGAVRPVPNGAFTDETIEQSDESSVSLTTDTWTLMLDGNYRQTASTYSGGDLGVFEWTHTWNRSADGTTLSGTESAAREGFVSAVSSSTVNFYFSAFEDGNTDRRVTFETSLSVTGSDYTFTVNDCYDNDNTDTDNPCLEFLYTSFTLTSSK